MDPELAAGAAAAAPDERVGAEWTGSTTKASDATADLIAGWLGGAGASSPLTVAPERTPTSCVAASLPR